MNLLHGDCIEEMAKLPENSVDAIVTDPPYGLGFMGKQWDSLPPGDEFAAEALRVLKPGGHLLAFGGTRTYHRLACAIEDAGFEIRDSLGWQHMDPVFCRCGSLPYSHDGHDHLRGVRQDVPDVPEATAEGQGADLLSSMQRQAPGAGVGEARPQGSSGLDGRKPSELHGEDARGAEPGLEGRGDVLAEEGELPRDQVRPSAGVGEADGSEGRLHHGAPATDGAADRSPAHPDGSGASHRPRSAEQRSDEPGTLAVEWIPQGGGAWPGCPRCGKPLEPPVFSGPLAWDYGSGFPKSLDVSKAIDKAAGAEREVVGRYTPPNGKAWNLRADESRPGDGGTMGAHKLRSESMEVTAPATPEAAQWQGWGTALKPAHEPIVVARKPLTGTVARNVLEFGTGAINVDGCRVESDYNDRELRPNAAAHNKTQGRRIVRDGMGTSAEDATQDLGYHNSAGRWPANVVLDPEAGALLDEQSGERPAGVAVRHASGGNTFGGDNPKPPMADMTYGDKGGASRFYYCAKASKRERNEGLEGFANGHPTVKPVALMRWLVRLVTPPNGTVLDPFLGSGTTGIAAKLEGFDFIGIERESEYLEIAKARIAHHGSEPEQMEMAA